MSRLHQGRLTAAALAALGAVGCVAALISNKAQAPLAYLAAFGWLASSALSALVLLAIGHAVSARWFVVLRGLCASLVATLPALPVLFVPVLLALPAIYPWAQQDAPSSTQQARVFGVPWMSAGPFLARAALYLCVWLVLGEALRRVSLAPARRTLLTRNAPTLGGVALPVLGVTGTWAAFDWLMSTAPGLRMTSLGMYWLTGGFAAAVGALAIVLYCARESGLLPPEVGEDHTFALARLQLSAVCLWAYIAVSQLIIVWSADLPSEAAFYVARSAGAWRYFSALLVLGHFVLPFLLLLSYRWKRRPAFAAAMGGWIVLMHGLDSYWLLVPGSARGPSLFDAAPFVLLGALGVLLGLLRFSAGQTVPADDPALAASLGYEAR
ncbi:MAG: hypothetical protein ABIQ16_22910 [Polyangiaceae bacterium]